jgi:hypothetical protein
VVYISGQQIQYTNPYPVYSHTLNRDIIVTQNCVMIIINPSFTKMLYTWEGNIGWDIGNKYLYLASYCNSSFSCSNRRFLCSVRVLARPPGSSSRPGEEQRRYSFLRSCQLCSYLRTSQYSMEQGDSLPRSQEPFTGLYPQPDRSNPYHPILPL